MHFVWDFLQSGLCALLAMIYATGVVVALRPAQSKKRNTKIGGRYLMVAAPIGVWVLTRLLPWLWASDYSAPLWYGWLVTALFLATLFFALFWRLRWVAWGMFVLVTIIVLIDHPWFVEFTLAHLCVALLVGGAMLLLPYKLLGRGVTRGFMRGVMWFLGVVLVVVTIYGLIANTAEFMSFPHSLGWAFFVVLFAAFTVLCVRELRRHTRGRLIAAILTAIVAIVVGVLLITSMVGSGSASAGTSDRPHTAASPSASASVSSSASPSVSPSASASAATCPIGTWTMNVGIPDMTDGKWLKDGSPMIAAAKTDEAAKVAAMDWLNQARSYTGLLSGAAAYLLHQQVDPSTLIQGSCASTAAVNLYSELATAIEVSTVTPGNVPTNAYNSTTNNGAVVPATTPGITGADLKAVQVTTKDGTVIYIMARCGNAATVGPPPVVPKPTPTPTTHTTPPTTPATTPPVVHTTPPPHTTPPASPPQVILDKLNDVEVSGTSPNFCITVNAPGGDSTTVSIDGGYGSVNVKTLTIHGYFRECDFVYTAPSEVPPGGTDVVTVSVHDNVTGLPASGATPPFTIKPFNGNR